MGALDNFFGKDVNTKGAYNMNINEPSHYKNLGLP